MREWHIKISMTGKGRCTDNIYIERFRHNEAVKGVANSIIKCDSQMLYIQYLETLNNNSEETAAWVSIRNYPLLIDGTIGQEKKIRHRTAREKSRENHKIPVEEKESYRWLKTYRKANEVALQVPDTMVITVTDREADMYDLYHEAQHAYSSRENTGAYWLILSSSNRKILNSNGKPEDDKLIEKTKSTLPLCVFQ